MNLHAELMRLPLRRPFRIATGTRRLQRNLLVRVETGTLIACGEAAETAFQTRTPDEVLAEARSAAPRLDGLDPAAPSLDALVDQAARDLPPSSPLRCALETALADLWARHRRRPLWQTLGLQHGPLPRSSFTIGLDTPELLREKLAEAAGLPILKIKLGAEDDERTLTLVRGLTDATLRVDANGGWTPETAPERLRLCADCAVELVEQPLPPGHIDETARLADSSPIPIILDEDCRTHADVPRLAGKVHGVNVKLRKAGGPLSALRLIRAARAAGLRVMIGCFIESSVAITAAAHLASLADWLDLDGHRLITRDPFRGVAWNRGALTLPTDPGLGLSPR
jgi:L-alanine-DL-glutamate epimerase-like enolase superfamily enzyme